METGGRGNGGDFKPKNILVTGGAGFIASHVVIQLVKRFPESKIVCFDKIDYCSSLSNLDSVKECLNFKFIKGNLLSADLINYVLEEENIDTILHAAAQTHVDNSFGNSFAFTENNVMGTHVLIETAKNIGIKRFIHVSTDEVASLAPSHARLIVRSSLPTLTAGVRFVVRGRGEACGD